MYSQLLQPIKHFLHCETPDSWIDKAKQPAQLPLLLTDHLICELKAAQTAMWLLRKYVVNPDDGDVLLSWLKPYEDFVYRHQGSLSSLAQHSGLSKKVIPRSQLPYGQPLLDKMVLLINEELHHFYQVLEIMQARKIPYHNLPAGRYAKKLMQKVATHEPNTMIDKLICGAYIEARSCERFAKLAPYLDADLQKFYFSLLRSEARHYQDYLTLAKLVAGGDVQQRINQFGQFEAELIQYCDEEFRFHSGSPLR